MPYSFAGFAGAGEETSLTLDLLLGRFQIGAQRIGQPVGEVRQAHQHVEIDNLLGWKMRLQRIDVGVIDVVRLAG